MSKHHDLTIPNTHDLIVLINTKTGQPEIVECSCGFRWILVPKEDQ